MNQISTKIVADSLHPNGIDRLTTMQITFPRFILAELNTHRMLSKNSASSRAIPFLKMVKNVQENPFIPIAWQVDHKGMQGNEYYTDDIDIKGFNQSWLGARDMAVESAVKLNNGKVTKQLCNRLLEPFMWHTVLISGTAWENFFELRCPQYQLPNKEEVFKSWKELTDYYEELHHDFWTGLHLEEYTLLERLKCNKGQAEIHMMALAEAMYDAINESKPKELKKGDWHIPYADTFEIPQLQDLYRKECSFGYDPNNPTPDEYYYKGLEDLSIKLSTAMCARISYTIVGEEKEATLETLLRIHDRMANQVPFHASPFEHCAKVMDEKEYKQYVKGKMPNNSGTSIIVPTKDMKGWCRNYKSFVQYREILENK